MNKVRWAIGIGAVLAACQTVAVLKWDEWVTKPGLRGGVLAGLNGPDEAVFRGEVIGPTGLLCGEVNGRNAMGGFAGFVRFISHEDGFALPATGRAEWRSKDAPQGEAVLAEVARQAGELMASGRSPADASLEKAEFEVLWRTHCARGV